MERFGLLVSTEQQSQGALLNVPKEDTSTNELTVTDALNVIKENPEKVILGLKSWGNKEVTDDVTKLFTLLNIVINNTEFSSSKEVLVLFVLPSKIELIKLSPEEAKFTINRFIRGDA